PYGTAYVGFVGEEPVAHLGMTTMWAGNRVAARACRMVVKPEWQGAGIGMRFLNTLAQRELDGEGWAKRPAPTYFHTAHPALLAALKRDRRWRQVSAKLHGGRAAKVHGKQSMKYGGHWRGVAGFAYGLEEK
ncbi:MAG TPA: ABC transporter ATP-binding protein, partial [Actinomycetota bacterium]|nr:ABC transporter ATP-binding protein [Actinomycetota bacterium]